MPVRGIYLVFLLFLFASCVNDMKDIEALDRKVESIDEFTNIKMSYSDGDSATIRVLIQAPLMLTLYEKNKLVEDQFPQGVKAEFFDENGAPNSWLSSKKAIRYPKKELVVVRDSVVLYNIEGDTLRTDELYWDSKKGEIYTERAFRYSKVNGERILGRKFQSDQNFKEYSFEQMSGTIKTDF